MEESSCKGKAKVDNWMSEGMQEPLPSLNKEEVSENGSTVSCFTEENTPQLIHQPSDHDVALANPRPRVLRVGQPSNLLSNEFPILDTSAIFFANMAKNGNADNTNGNLNFEGTEEGDSGKEAEDSEDMQEPENESVLVEDSLSFTEENMPLLIHQPSDHDLTLVNSSGDNATGSASPKVIRVDHGEPSRKNRRFLPYLSCAYCKRGFRTTQGLSRHQLTHNQPKDQRPAPSNLSIPVLDTSAIFFANMMKIGNANNTNGNGNLQGFGAPNANINSTGGGLNSIGMVDCTYQDALMRVVTNSCYPSVGFKGADTSGGVVGNYFGSSQDEGEGRGEDGSIDLLSRVGMDSGENEKSDSKGGDEDDDES